MIMGGTDAAGGTGDNALTVAWEAPSHVESRATTGTPEACVNDKATPKNAAAKKAKTREGRVVNRVRLAGER
ncbi:MAG: hypothetical protein M3O36_06260 [Myxococcota bacterium]|nr:hypothetical protein [Myxococcota bacterium]